MLRQFRQFRRFGGVSEHLWVAAIASLMHDVQSFHGWLADVVHLHIVQCKCM